ncbi:hypothetical protein RCL_jg11346.t1 [Rhizophagus clarus]|uniref:Reverse transcriptase domain-containing protein n=1 Tax=Rhizophagus clarus TaxID=94130 RepID=A0A8H3LL22_9GLOM|nr:hypothetical protein RCL_jg11346.t1 [Rhizophagus clarus]
MNLIIEDAKVKKKSLWILFQDLPKAYNRVDIEMLELTLNRIKIPKRIVQLLVNLFSNSRKTVIKTTGTTQFYKVLIRIDQDTLYKLECILQIADEFNKLNNIQINPEKFTLMTNDINALKDKFVKLNFGSHVQEIQLIRPIESVRILSAWINLNLSKVYVINQCKNIITGYNKIIRNKQLTVKIMRYIYN